MIQLSRNSVFILVCTLLIVGCTPNARKFNEHKTVSLATLDHDLPTVIEFCERFFINKKPDLNYLSEHGFQEHKLNKNNKNKKRFMIFSRDKITNENNDQKFRSGSILVELGKTMEPSCGPLDINGSSIIRKMDIRLKTALRKKGYRFKNKLETITALPKEVYVKDGDVYLIETITTKQKDRKYIELSNFKIRKLRINEKYYDQIWPLIHTVRKENVFTHGYTTFQQTYLIIDFFKKLKPDLDINELVLASRKSNYNQYVPKDAWKNTQATNTRIANQRAATQVQRVQQQNKQFINNTRARNPAPPTGLN